MSSLKTLFLLILSYLLLASCTSKKKEISEAERQEFLEAASFINETPYEKLSLDVQELCDKHQYNSISLSLGDLVKVNEEIDLSTYQSFKLPQSPLATDSSLYEIIIDHSKNNYYIRITNGFNGSNIYGPGSL